MAQLSFRILVFLLVMGFAMVCPSLSNSEVEHGGRRILSKGQHGSHSLHSTSAVLKAVLTRREPLNLGTTDRVIHAVKTSKIRSRYIKSLLRKHGSQKDFQSPISTVPGGYAMSLELGTPPQKFTVIADTGSDLTWVQCVGCTTCINTTDPAFNPEKSSTYKPLDCSSSMCQSLGQQSTCKGSGSCTYTYEYGDQSTTNGAFSHETITLSSTTRSQQSIPNFAFGCGSSNKGTFQDVDGLLGLGQGPISFPSQLGSDYGHVFSYCLESFTDGPTKTSPIVFGASAVPERNVLYTPLQTAENFLIPTFWFISLQSVSVNGKTLHVEGERPSLALNLGTVIDSGTTITELDADTYKALTKSLESSISYAKVSGSSFGLDLCYSTSNVHTPTFPSLTFHFQNADWVTPWQNVFIPVDDAGTYCLAVLSSNQGINIFGNIQQQNFQVIYDQPNSQLGWVSAQCDALAVW